MLGALLGGALSVAHGSWMMPPPGYRAKDFCVVKHQGVYHVFYIRHNIALPDAQTENDLGHAISTDLYAWTQLDPVMTVPDSGWDRTHVWAPHIIKRDGIFYMFYTGVLNEPGAGALWQRTGIATSTDLMEWNRMDDPIFACDQVPWSFCDSTSYSSAFRDPFVMPDPGVPGSWLMYYSAAPAIESLSTVVAVARSGGDFTQWQDEKPLWITHQSVTYNPLVESAHLYPHNGLWYMFFTTSSGQPITFATSPNPIGDPSEWTYRGRLGFMLGLDTRGWFASEAFADGTRDYFAFINGERVEIRRLLWDPGWTFRLGSPEVFHVVSMNWSTPTIRDGDTLSLSLVSTYGTGQVVELDAVLRYADGSEIILAKEALGMPNVLTLAGNLTTWSWKFTAPAEEYAARRIAASPALPIVANAQQPAPTLFLRTRDLTCESGALSVLGDTIIVEPPQPDPEPEPDPDPADNGGDPQGLRPILRNAVGLSGPRSVSLIVELPAAGEGRIDVFDVQGRRVRNVANRMLPRGASVLAWDGRDDAGATASRGLYFARLQFGAHAYTTRFVLR